MVNPAALAAPGFWGQHSLHLSPRTHLSLTAPSYRLKTLSGTALTGPDGTEVRAPLTQPRRLALLAYLAIERPGSFHRRDQLLALFWPELDAGRARAALSQAVYVLRQALGEATLPSRGTEELGVDPARLWCDAAECDRLLRAGERERALDLYAGDLLPGFHLDEAPEFDRWLEATRDDLRQRAAQAAMSLTAAAESTGDVRAGVRWARRALQLAPFDEPTLRQLLLASERAGDRSGALLAYQEFVDRLRSELDLEPSPATIGLVDRLRTRPIPAQMESAAPPTSPIAVAEDVFPPAPARRTAPRFWQSLLVLAMLALALFIGFRWSRPTPVAIPASERVVVLPFVVRGDSGLEYLREGMVDLLSTRLDGLGSLRAIDPTAVLARTARAPVPGPALAAAFGATLYAEGSITVLGQALDLRMTLHDAGGVALATVAGRAADQDGLGPLVDSLAGALFATRLSTPGERLTREATQTTSSGAALRSYLDGERHYRNGEYSTAVEDFARSVTQDSLFALAWYRLSVAAGWVGASGGVVEHAMDRALALAHRLTPRDRRLLEAYSAWLGRAARASDAELRLRALTLDYPDDADAWYWLGEVLYHANPERGRPIAAAELPFQRAAALVPDGNDAAGHLLYLRAFSGDRSALDSALTDRLDRLPATAAHRAVFLLLERALNATDAEWRRTLDSLRSAPGGTLAIATMVTGRFEGTLARADDLARLLQASARPRSERIQGFTLSATIRLAGGRWGEAEAALRQLQQLDAAAAQEVRGYFAALPWLPLTADERRAVRQRVAEWPAATQVDPAESPGSGLTQSLLRQFYLGALSALAGDSAAATAALAGMPLRDTLSPADARVLQTTRAVLALTAGDATAALRALAPVPDTLPRSAIVNGFGFGHGYERWLRAEALEATGRPAEAIGWYQSFESWPMVDVVWLAPSLMQRGRLYEQAGQRDSARVAYGRALAVWSGSDARFGPAKETARARLAVLQDQR